MNKVKVISANIILVLIIVLSTLYMIPKYAAVIKISQGKAEIDHIKTISKQLVDLPEKQREIYFDYLRAKRK